MPHRARAALSPAQQGRLYDLCGRSRTHTSEYIPSKPGVDVREFVCVNFRVSFETRTLDSIQREVRLESLARFLMIYRSGNGDYTAEWRTRTDDVTVGDALRGLG